jgi:hypothetical protein
VILLDRIALSLLSLQALVLLRVGPSGLLRSMQTPMTTTPTTAMVMTMMTALLLLLKCLLGWSTRLETITSRPRSSSSAFATLVRAVCVRACAWPAVLGACVRAHVRAHLPPFVFAARSRSCRLDAPFCKLANPHMCKKEISFHMHVHGPHGVFHHSLTSIASPRRATRSQPRPPLHQATDETQ